MSQAIWMGPATWEAQAAFRRAREAGMSLVRAYVIGNVASHKHCWTFRSRLAAWVGCSVRTVQRALTQAASLGLIGVARAKQGEIPPGRTKPVPCGWSHRWTVGWGKAGDLLKRAIDVARVRWNERRAITCKPKPPAPRVAHRRWTAEELDAELARLVPGLPREKPPPE